jgi:hypothetical protein
MVLRGDADYNYLLKIKHIVRFVCHVAHSLRFVISEEVSIGTRMFFDAPPFLLSSIPFHFPHGPPLLTHRSCFPGSRLRCSKISLCTSRCRRFLRCWRWQRLPSANSGRGSTNIGRGCRHRTKARAR